jgi:tetratricopeptide (TPR) repeat protein
MNAVISGQAGRALLVDGDSLQSFDVDDPSSLVPRVPADFVYIFGEMQDLRVIENTDIESVQRELKDDSDCALALELALISLDSELPDDIRQEAIAGLDELLANDRVPDRLENVLYARPIPEDADLTAALQLSDDASLSCVSSLLRRLEQREPFISEVSEAWDSIPTKVFGDYDQQAEFMRIAVREGLFRTLVIARESQGTTAAFLLSAGLNSSIKQLKNHREVLKQWTAFFPRFEGIQAIENEIEEEMVPEALPKRRHGRRIGINRRAILSEVNKQKATISVAMNRRDFGLVRHFVNDLVSYQLRNGETQHAAKSLCDLAAEAEALEFYSLQFELTERSVNIAPDDARSWTQHGQALLNLQRLDEALRAYNQAEAFGGGVVARVGQAEVLKSQRRLDEALKSYDATLAEYPHAISACSGRAEVLMMLGKFNDALVAYNDILIAHPEDVVARNGQANVLRAMGRLDSALLAYNNIISDYPENKDAQSGRDNLVKAKDRLHDDLVRYNRILVEDPEDDVAQKGRSEVFMAIVRLDNALVAFNRVGSLLAASGRYHDALKLLPKKSPVGQQDWLGYQIRGLIFLRIGEQAKAVKIFNEGERKNALPSSKQHFINGLAVTCLHKKDFKKAGQTLERITSPLLQPSANVLRLHAFGALGDIERAKAAYKSLKTGPHFISDELAQELHRKYILRKKPNHDEEWLLDQELALLLSA